MTQYNISSFAIIKLQHTIMTSAILSWKAFTTSSIEIYTGCTVFRNLKRGSAPRQKGFGSSNLQPFSYHPGSLTKAPPHEQAATPQIYSVINSQLLQSIRDHRPGHRALYRPLSPGWPCLSLWLGLRLAALTGLQIRWIKPLSAGSFDVNSAEAC